MKFDIKKIKKAHFIGIGGIGMSGLAYWFLKKNKEVTGSDISKTDITSKLEKDGIKIFYTQKKAHITHDVDCVIYTQAIGEDNPEYIQAKKMNIPTYTFHEALSSMLIGMFTIVISGTHGKTTTTAMIGKILHDAGFSPTIVCGGVMSDFKSNIVIGEKPYAVVEGCEYRRSFLNLIPNILAITNIELDHTDYYKDLSDLQSAFIELKNSIPVGGNIICDPDSDTVRPIVRNNSAPVFDYKKCDLENWNLKVLGSYNRKNAQVACMVGQVLKIDENSIKESLESFSGTERRFEYKGHAQNGALLYDDYAHHPTAIKEFLFALKEKYPEKKKIIVFQAHLFSRTKDFLPEFKTAFSDADIVIVTPIFPAREKNIFNISHLDIVNALESNGTKAIPVENFEEAGEKALSLSDSNSVIVSLGAGEQYKVIDLIL